MKTTNYFNTFIEVAEDCPVAKAEIPPQKGDAKTVANLQFDIIKENPYKITSDEVIFNVHVVRSGIGKEDMDKEKEAFFSKGQPCLRASPLTKRYGWGIHSNEEGKIALYGLGTEEYRKMAEDPALKHIRAMRSVRK